MEPVESGSRKARVFWIRGPELQQLTSRVDDLLSEHLGPTDTINFERTTRTDPQGNVLHEATLILS